MIHTPDCVGLALSLIAPALGIVLHDLGGQQEHVLMHQRHSQLRGVDGSACRVGCRQG